MTHHTLMVFPVIGFLIIFEVILTLALCKAGDTRNATISPSAPDAREP